MQRIDETLEHLAARLPELEWKLNQHRMVLNRDTVPQGLFRSEYPLSVQSCLTEIKTDLNHLKKPGMCAARQFLAEKVQKKINVLIKLHKTQLQGTGLLSQKPQVLGSIATRQQWLAELEAKIATLTEQREAMTARLDQLNQRGCAETRLSLQAELGQIERQLSLAQETWQRATSVP